MDTAPKLLSPFRMAWLGLAGVSGIVNLLTLTGAFFMLQVYDRVLPGRSVSTLVALAVIAALLFVFQGALEFIRSRLLVRIGMSLDAKMAGDVLYAVIKLPLRARPRGDGLQPMRDLDQIRSFISGSGPTALFDLPWLPIYIGICFLFHVWIGLAALAGAIILIGLTLLTEFLTKTPALSMTEHYASRNALAEGMRRNAEVLKAMGFGDPVAMRWAKSNTHYQLASARTADTAGTVGTISKTFRIMLQSAILAIGALLVIAGEATGGIMIASSIMTSRALAPIDIAIGNWKGFVAARQSWNRLKHVLGAVSEQPVSLQLDAPSTTLSVENLSLAPPGENRLVVQDVNFVLHKGAGLGIIGPSASGKSSLVKAIAGVWLPARGGVRLDGATLDQWMPAALGRHIGYVPQDVQLFSGTIAENIARFDPDATSDLILAATRSAGVHDMIVRLEDGYDTQVGEAGNNLSAGQRQRLALARALYGQPFLVILDEPNSNLDSEGEAALTHAIKAVRERGGIAIVVAHRPSALANLDQVLVVGNGRMQAFGPKDEVLRKATRPAHASTPLKVVASDGGGI